MCSWVYGRTIVLRRQHPHEKALSSRGLNRGLPRDMARRDIFLEANARRSLHFGHPVWAKGHHAATGIRAPARLCGLCEAARRPRRRARFDPRSDSYDALTALLHRAFAPLGALGFNCPGVDQPASATRERVLPASASSRSAMRTWSRR